MCTVYEQKIEETRKEIEKTLEEEQNKIKL